jgi:uncharacterized protein (TIGR03067 family)
MRRRVLLIIVSCALLGFAPAPFPKTERRRAEDLTDVGGTWAILRWERRGSREEDAEKRYRVRFTKEQFELIRQDGGSDDTYAMRLEPSYAPMAFRWSRKDSISFVGSYRLRKDEMTLIFNRGDRLEARPTDFLGEAEFRFILRRVQR